MQRLLTRLTKLPLQPQQGLGGVAKAARQDGNVKVHVMRLSTVSQSCHIQVLQVFAMPRVERVRTGGDTVITQRMCPQTRVGYAVIE